MKLPDGPRTPPFIRLIEAIVRLLERLEADVQRYGDPCKSRLNWSAPVYL